MSMNFCPPKPGLTPVSYTHLDLGLGHGLLQGLFILGLDGKPLGHKINGGALYLGYGVEPALQLGRTDVYKRQV